MQRVAIEMEFLFRASPTILYKFLTDASCLIRWFCDEVDIEKGVYSYVWEGSEEVAKLIDDIEDERLRFKWDEGEEGEYLEFRMKKSPVTGETILELTDYCDDDEIEEQKQLWSTQMAQLRRETGG